MTPLDEKVGFKRPTTRYRKNSILCGELLSGNRVVDFLCGAELRTSRGIKGKGPLLTFDPYMLLSVYIRKPNFFFQSSTNT